jgi:hypothetical protein
MRRIASILIGCSLAACSPRQVQVQTGTAPAAQATLEFSNHEAQPVNVYVVSGGTDLFLKQVAPNTTESLPLRGITIGSTVRLRAARADGTKAYSKDGVTVATAMTWSVP